eukprot:TRINITY_DN3276_c2_g1_i1.p2 TRINITY_DN3276_c2_g1~~TRINITY_DN3276_c2_g1_i1.p2  ORF type:complete len:138 (-),score=41.69 TRINITY_DN3276_c2_g1_i1:3193-3606(-)
MYLFSSTNPFAFATSFSKHMNIEIKDNESDDEIFVEEHSMIPMIVTQIPTVSTVIDSNINKKVKKSVSTEKSIPKTDSLKLSLNIETISTNDEIKIENSEQLNEDEQFDEIEKGVEDLVDWVDDLLVSDPEHINIEL